MSKKRKTKNKKAKRKVHKRKELKTGRPGQAQRAGSQRKVKIGIGTPKYLLNRDFEFIQELRDLILKSSPAEKEEITERLYKLGKIKLAVIAGVFLNKENLDGTATDLFMVSDDIDRKKLNSFLKYLEAETGGEVRFVVMEKDEFMYRLSMFDRFVRVLLEGPHEKLINKLGL